MHFNCLKHYTQQPVLTQDQHNRCAPSRQLAAAARQQHDNMLSLMMMMMMNMLSLPASLEL